MKRLLLFAAALVALAQAASAQMSIKAGTAVEIRIQGVPASEVQLVNNTYPVAEDGTINVPLLGKVRAAGLSPQGLGSSIEHAYKAAEIYTHPTIQVISSTTDSITKQMVTVGGHVKSPGPVEWTQGLTLYNAIQAARGADEFGAMNRVIVVRGAQSKEYDMGDVKHMNILVQPSDTIQVPQKNILGR